MAQGESEGTVVNLDDRRRVPETLQSGNGNGTFDGMETRVRLLEAQAGRVEKVLDRIDQRLEKMGSDLSEMKGRVNAMPTTWQMVTFVVGIAVAVFTIARLLLPGA